MTRAASRGTTAPGDPAAGRRERRGKLGRERDGRVKKMMIATKSSRSKKLCPRQHQFKQFSVIHGLQTHSPRDLVKVSSAFSFGFVLRNNLDPDPESNIIFVSLYFVRSTRDLPCKMSCFIFCFIFLL